MFSEVRTRGVNKYPVFFSDAERNFFARTPKRVIFQLLRDCAIQLASLGHDGYLDTWFDKPEIWLDEAKSRIQSAI